MELFNTLNERFGEYGSPVAFSPDSSVLAVWGEAKALLPWEVHQSRWLPWIPGAHTHWGMDVVLDGQFLEKLMSTGRARAWPLVSWRSGTRQVEGTLDAEKDGCRLLCWGPESVVEVAFPGAQGSRGFSRDGRLMAAAQPSGSVAVYDTATLEERWAFQARKPERVEGKEANFVFKNARIQAFSPDATLLAVSDDLSLRLPSRHVAVSLVQTWKISKQQDKAYLVGAVQAQRVDMATFSPDSSLLAMAVNGYTRVYRSRSMELVAEVGVPDDDIIIIVFSPDGRFLATGGFDGDLWFWETETWRLVSTLAAHPDCEDCRMTGQFQSLYDIAWSPDGKLLATSGEEKQDKSIKLWLVS